MFPRRRAKLHPYRVGFWAVVAVALVVALLDRSPLTLDAGDPELGGRYVAVEGEGDILVVISEESLTGALAHESTDHSWVWVDAIRQEVGPVTTADIAEVTPEKLQPFRSVVVTAGAAADPRLDGVVPTLEGFASRGGALAIELPAGLARSRFGADGEGGWRRADSITAAEGVPDTTLDTIRAIPLLARYRGSTRPLADATTLLAMDGAPVIYERTVGSGTVAVVDFEFSEQISRMQQGVHGPDGRVRPHVHGEPIRTVDLYSTSSLLGAALPYADLLERYTVRTVLGHDRPLFAFWPYPDGKQGALLSSHTASTQIGRPLWMSIHERSLDARSTTYIAPPPREPDTTAAFPDAEFVGHAAMLWDLDPEDSGLFKHYGVLGFDPVRQPLTLVGQMERLENLLGDDADIRGVRVRGGRWTRDFTAAYRVMEAAELRYSTTYGPVEGAPSGFLFGTCQPFTPLDLTGAPFRLQEVPVCFDNPSTPEEADLLQAALENAARDAWAVHLLTAADRFRVAPDLSAFDIWRDALRTADRLDMWVGGAGEFVGFQHRRAGSSLHVIAEQVTARNADGEPRTIDYTIELETTGRGIVLMVPVTAGDLTFDQATRGGAEARQYEVAGQLQTSASTYLGSEVRLVALNPGFTTVGIRYTR